MFKKTPTAKNGKIECSTHHSKYFKSHVFFDHDFPPNQLVLMASKKLPVAFATGDRSRRRRPPTPDLGEEAVKDAAEADSRFPPPGVTEAAAVVAAPDAVEESLFLLGMGTVGTFSGLCARHQRTLCCSCCCCFSPADGCGGKEDLIEAMIACRSWGMTTPINPWSLRTALLTRTETWGAKTLRSNGSMCCSRAERAD